jgi:hypothetical protein
MKRVPLTEDEWREVAIQAYYCRENLMQITSLLSTRVRFGALDKHIRLIRQLDQVRSDLEDEMFHQGKVRDLDIFYPGSMTPEGFRKAGQAAQARKDRDRP